MCDTKKSAYKIIIITGSEISHKYFVRRIADVYNVRHIFAIHSGLSDEEFFLNAYNAHTDEHSALVLDEIRLRKRYQAELLPLTGERFPDVPITRFKEGKAVNNRETIEKIKNLYPTHILLYGAPILSKVFIDAIDCPIINLHMGVVPKYRGGDANYTALYYNDYENVGYTFHHTIPSLDAGKIVYIGRYMNYKKGDSYPRITVELLIDATENIIKLIPQIKEKVVEKEKNLPRLLYGKEFGFAHLRKVKADFESNRHLLNTNLGT